MMPPNKTLAEDDESNPGKMTDGQASELRELCEATGEEFDEGLSSKQAEERIELLRKKRDG